MATDRMIRELRTWLESDILEYRWIVQLAMDHNEGVSDEVLRTLVCDAVKTLLEVDLAIIGETYLDDNDGRLHIREWPGTLAEKLSRVNQVIDKEGLFPKMWHGFWIQRRDADRPVPK